MTCPNCQKELPHTQGKFCPYCGAQLNQLQSAPAAQPSNDSTPPHPAPTHAPSPSGNTTPSAPAHRPKYSILFLFLSFILSLIVIVNDDSLTLSPLTIGCVAISFGVWLSAYMKNKKNVAIGASCFPIAVYLIFLGAINDFPGIIREIPGEFFIVSWFSFIFVLLVFCIIIQSTICRNLVKKNLNQVFKPIYSDSDLMILQKFDRYQSVGYYLLKGLLHGVLKLSHTEETAESKSIPIITINPEWSEADLQEYCEKNPQVQKIVQYIQIKQTADDAPVALSSIVRSVTPNLSMQSEGGKILNAVIEKITKVSDIFWKIFIFSAYYIAITKLAMGLYNEKDVANLIGTLIFFTIFGLWISSSVFHSIANSLIQKQLIGKLVRFKSSHILTVYQTLDATDFEGHFTDEEISTYLRAYALSLYTDKSKQSPLTVELLAAVSVARIAANASSDSGCSGCSSCSSCGGCGGCGGCGD